MTPLYVGLLCALIAMTILLFVAVFAALVYRQAWQDAYERVGTLERNWPRRDPNYHPARPGDFDYDPRQAFFR